jgi:Cd2+/Zn2+-exporting ATPase
MSFMVNNTLESTIQIDIPLILPEIVDVADACIGRLERALKQRKGISQVHITKGETPKLCLHYDPNLISLQSVERLARDEGSDFTRRYRHEEIPLGLNSGSADAADSLTEDLNKQPGILHANVNFASGLAYVAYDTQTTERAKIEHFIRHLGYRTAVAKDAPPEDHHGLESLLPEWIQERLGLILISLAGIFFLAGWLGEVVLGLPESVTIGLFILAYITGGYDIATHAVPGLLKGHFDTDVLMLAAAIGAALLGEWAEGAFLLFLFGLGHAGEHYALDKARDAINALGELMPRSAMVKVNGDVKERPVEALVVGEVVVVRPGDRVPVDGEIVNGRSAIDESAITGESVPVNKALGDEVFAGTVNRENALEIQVTRLAADNTLSRVMQMVAEAQAQQSPTQRFTQKFTSRFVPAVLIFVGLVVAIPPLLGWMPLEQSFYRGMLLLVAASPCALAIGTPAAVLTGIAQAARNGVMIKGGVHLENLGALKVLAFDKTGTLTKGQFQVTDIIPLNVTNEEALLRLAAGVERQSAHPLAEAVVRAAEDRGLRGLPEGDGLENIEGRGVRSIVNGRPILIGSLKLFPDVAQEIRDIVSQLETEGKTTMIVQHDGRFLGVLALADTVRMGVADVLRQLKETGIERLVMLTGDNERAAAEVGRQVGIADVRAGLLPEEKLAAIRQIQDTHGSVAMTGDGVNDAPALATATVGIAMGGAGTAVALETADVALMADDLSRLPFAVSLSRASRAIIRQNVAIALGIILLLILTSVTGLIELTGAVILHEGSTIIVILNALRLLGFKYN